MAVADSCIDESDSVVSGHRRINRSNGVLENGLWDYPRPSTPILQYSNLFYRVKPKNFTALSSMIFLRTSGFMLTCWNSSNQRSTPMAGQSEPNMALSWS